MLLAGVQLEQPFPYMPLLDICQTTLRDIERLSTEAAMLEALGSERLAVSGMKTAAAAAAADAPGMNRTRQQSCTVVDVPAAPTAAAVHHDHCL